MTFHVRLSERWNLEIPVGHLVGGLVVLALPFFGIAMVQDRTPAKVARPDERVWARAGITLGAGERGWLVIAAHEPACGVRIAPGDLVLGLRSLPGDAQPGAGGEFARTLAGMENLLRRASEGARVETEVQSRDGSVTVRSFLIPDFAPDLVEHDGA